MAEYEERSLEDLTEEPSAHRLEELRTKGQVAQSRELSSVLALFGVFLAVYFMSSNFVEAMTGWMRDVFTVDLSQKFDGSDLKSFSGIGMRALKILSVSFLTVSLAGLTLGVLGSVSQVGFLFTTETLTPDLKRIDPISGFMRLFSLKSLVEGAKALAKLLAVGSVVYFAIESRIDALPSLSGLTPRQLIAFLSSTVARVFGVVLLLLVVAAAFDYWIQWRRFRRQAMMTKAEAKQEHKEREGDPQIKARIRAIQREAARKRMMKSVPKADVVVTNPTHIAVAIRYDPNEAFAPRVVAKGGDYLAERIKKIARENGIPTVENRPLARTLYKHVKVGQMIPRSLYQAVAEILAYVYKIKGRRAPSEIQK